MRLHFTFSNIYYTETPATVIHAIQFNSIQFNSIQFNSVLLVQAGNSWRLHANRWHSKINTTIENINTNRYIWRVSSQNGLTPFWSIWDIWDLSCWNIKKIIRKFVILLIITSRIFLYIIMRKVSLERYYFVLYDCALTSKMSKMALKSFCDKTLHTLSNFLHHSDIQE